MEKYYTSLDYSYTLGMSISIELLMHHPDLVSEVYYSSHIYQNEYFNLLAKECAKHDIDLIEDDDLISSLSVKENCYVIAKFKKFNTPLTDDNHLVLGDMDDEGVLGTLIRSAVSFNHKNIVLINPMVDYFDPRVVRASMGAIFHANIKIYDNLDDYLKDYPKLNKYLLVNDGDDIKEVNVLRPYSLISFKDYKVFEGIDKLEIKHNKKVALNLPFALAIAMHHLYYLNLKR